MRLTKGWFSQIKEKNCFLTDFFVSMRKKAKEEKERKKEEEGLEEKS